MCRTSSTSPDIDASTLTHQKYAMFWPSTNPPADPNYTWQKAQCRWRKVWLNPVTGLVSNSVRTATGRVAIRHQRADTYAFPPICPKCGADERRATNYPTPIRNHRTGFQRGSQVLAATLLREIEHNETPLANRRKIVLFSDSRQDAAKLAAGMELDHFRDMVRIAMLEAHKEFQQDLLAAIRHLLAKNPEAAPRVKEANEQLFALAAGAETPSDKHAYRNLRKSSRELCDKLTDWMEYGELDGTAAHSMLWLVSGSRLMSRSAWSRTSSSGGYSRWA